MDDLRAVLQAVGSERASLLAWSQSGPMAMLFASTYPELTSVLVFGDCYARLARAPDYPIGMPQRLIDAAVDFTEKNWGTGAQLDVIAPDLAGDTELRTAVARYQRQAASPGAAAAMSRMLFEVDVRHVLPSIQVPTLVLQHADSWFARAGHGRYLADHIPGARYIEFPGSDPIFLGRDREEQIDEIEEFLTGVRPEPQADRVLATVLFTDVVDSTKHAATRGDRAWRDLLERHRDLVLVSSTVKDLVAGSGIQFDDRGAHTLKGVPGEWHLFAVHG